MMVLLQKLKKVRLFKSLIKNTIIFRITLFCLSAVCLIAVCIGLILGTKIYSLVQEENNTYLENLLHNLNLGIENLIGDANRVNRMLISHVETQNILIRCQSEGYDPQAYQNDAATLSYIVNTLTITDSHLSASFYDADGNTLFGDNVFIQSVQKNIFQEPWLKSHKEEIDNRQRFLISPNHLHQRFYRDFRPFMIIRPLKDITTQKVVAYVVIYADCKDIENLLAENIKTISSGHQNGPVSAIRLLDDEERVVASTNSWENGIRFDDLSVQGKIMVQQLEDSQFQIVIEQSGSYFFSSFCRTLAPILILSLLLLVILGVLIIMVFRKMLFPLKQLIFGMAQIGKGKFKIQLDESICHDEDIRNVYQGFNKMVTKIDALITNVYNQQILLKSAQLESLKYQINPHFLYNTLQTIESIAEIRNTPEVQIIATSLAQMFRYNLAPENLVPLKDEISHLEAYFSIERIRFRNQLNFSISISPEIYHSTVPKFILQPLVENAILHGFSSRSKDSYIKITGEQKEGKIQLHVIDNGRGIPPATLLSLQEKLVLASHLEDPVLNSESIGIMNVQKRILNCCGKEFGIKLFSNYGQGTHVVIELPLILVKQKGVLPDDPARIGG